MSEKKWYQKGLDWLLDKNNPSKKWFQRKIVWVGAVLVILIIMLANPKDGSPISGGKQVPDVFVINYTEAIEILEADGFEVKAVETSVKSISDKLLYPLETVDK